MPKVALNLQACKAKDADILAKLQKVQQAAQGSKQNTKLNQQRAEWTEQARKLASEARRLEDDLLELSPKLGVSSAPPTPSDDVGADVWFQINGARQLLRQVKRRNVDRLRQNPDQAVDFQSVLASVVTAISSFGERLGGEAWAMEQECAEVHRPLRRELTVDGIWSSERKAADEDRAGLSDEEDTLLERIATLPSSSSEAYQEDLSALNAEVTKELAALEKETAELRQKQKGWDDEAHFRFVCIKRQFQGRGRDLLLDRLFLEFPHLNREQISAHEEHCDNLRFASQRQHAAFRQWRRDRLALLRRHQGVVEERIRNNELMAVRSKDFQEQRGRQKKCHDRLEVVRARASSERSRKQQSEEEAAERVKAAEDARENAHRKHVQAMKRMSSEYVDKKREREQQAQDVAAVAAQRQAEQYALVQDKNAERVAMRKQMDDLKQREVNQQREAVQQERLEREARLERLIEKIRVEAPRDPERLLKVPQHSNVDNYLDPVLCGGLRGPQNQVHFDEKRLMADARYKISSALQAAGLFDTRAGHEIMAKVVGPRAACPQQVSTVFAAPPNAVPAGYPPRP